MGQYLYLYLMFLLSELTVLVVTLRVWFHGPAGEEVAHCIVANVLRHLAKLEEISGERKEGGEREEGERRERGGRKEGEGTKEAGERERGREGGGREEGERREGDRREWREEGVERESRRGRKGERS